MASKLALSFVLASAYLLAQLAAVADAAAPVNADPHKLATVVKAVGPPCEASQSSTHYNKLAYAPTTAPTPTPTATPYDATTSSSDASTASAYSAAFTQSTSSSVLSMSSKSLIPSTISVRASTYMPSQPSGSNTTTSNSPARSPCKRPVYTKSSTSSGTPMYGTAAVSTTAAIAPSTGFAPTGQTTTVVSPVSATPMMSAPSSTPTEASTATVPATTAKSSNSDSSNRDLLASVDFEDGTVGGDWKIVSNNALSQVVTTKAAHGSHSVRLAGGANYNDDAFLVNTNLFPMTPNQFYVRFYINLDTPLGEGHATFALASGPDPSTEVRLGGQFHILMVNIPSTDGSRISADSYNGFPNGVVLTPGTWSCIEILFDGPVQAMHTFVNNSEVKNLAITKPSDWTSPPGAQWMSTFSQIKLGWQTYGAGGANTVYLDDVAVSHSRIGCL